jgi:hypothetical protein
MEPPPLLLPLLLLLLLPSPRHSCVTSLEKVSL